ncbi:MAG: signal transduction histidine kinase, partial [Arcobacteraceae bacterium]
RKDRAMLHQSRLARMGTMLSMIAHQWRQPLSKVSALLMALETATKFKKSDDKMILSTIADSTKLLYYMSNTIEDFRNFFKPNKKKVDFYINDACNEAISLVEASIENFGIILSKDMKINPKINGFEREFAQVILNLLSNAKDVLKQREIIEPRIHLSVKAKDNHIIIMVQDNGGGVDEEHIEVIFEPYFTTKESLKGTGLGLYMSKMIIEKNIDGELSVENVNDGALFKIVLEG